MFKKIITTTLLVGFGGFLVWGGINRTLAKTGDGDTIGGQGRSQGSALSMNGDQESHSQGRGGNELASVNSHEEQVGGGQGGGRGGRSGQGRGWGQGDSKTSLDATEVEALQMALADEYHALAVYQTVIDQFGPVEPFVELARAEGQHIEALYTHFDKYGLVVPENTWLENIPPFESVQAACQAGAEAEQANVALYDHLLNVTDDPGLVRVFQNLQRASLESHLPQLESCE